MSELDEQLSAFVLLIRSIANQVYDEREANSRQVLLDDDEGVSIKEAALMLHTKPWKIYDLIGRHELPVVATTETGRGWRIRRGAIREFMNRPAST